MSEVTLEIVAKRQKALEKKLDKIIAALGIDKKKPGEMMQNLLKHQSGQKR